MRVILDLQGAQSDSRRRGIGRYSRNLALAMARSAGEHDLHILLNGTFVDETNELRSAFQGVLPDPNLHVWYGPGGHAANLEGSESRRRAAEHIRAQVVRALYPDLLLLSSLFEGFGDDAVTLWPNGVPAPATVAVCYDLIPLISPDFHFPSSLARDWYHDRLDQMRRMTGLLAISGSSRGEAVSALSIPEERLATIFAGVESPFHPAPVDSSVLDRYGLQPGFILCIGTVEPRKNLDGLIRAYALLAPELRARHRLVATGWNDTTRLSALQVLAARCGLPDGQVMLLREFVPDADLRAFYHACGVAVSPSLHEGFGLSAAEAMACGAATLGSNTTSLPEVIGDRRALFDPADPASIAERLTAVLTDPSLRRSLIDHGLRHVQSFTWERSAQRAWAALEAFEPLAAPRPSRRLRLAVITPAWELPDTLPESWTRGYDVEIISWETVSQGPGWRSFPPERLRAQTFDRVLYWPRDEPRHVRLAICLLAAFPGVIVANARDLAGALDDELDGDVGSREALILAATTLDMEGWRVSPSPMTWADFARAAAIGLISDMEEPCTFPRWIEAAYAGHTLAARDACIAGIAATPPSSQDASAIARAVSATFPAANPPALLLDASTIARHDAGTGVQRVVRELVRHLGMAPEQLFRLEPVAVSGPEMRRAAAFAARLFGHDASWTEPRVIATYPGDTFVALDLTLHDVDGLRTTLRQVRRTGGRACVVIYDLLPLLTPSFFPEPVREAFPRWLRMIAAEADRLICISRAVADELRIWLAGAGIARGSPLEVCWFHLGADFRPATPGKSDAEFAFAPVGPCFLMVGTLEPRKGHRLALAAFEEIWRDDIDATLVIAGRAGWMMEKFAAELLAHGEHGHRLIWLRDVSDAGVARLYRTADVLLMASEGEGFGLPLVEAARARLPVLARDIPVYREVAGDGARYFSGAGAPDLARALREWLAEHARGATPDPSRIQSLTWAESAAAFRDAALGSRVYYTWAADVRSAA